MQLAGKIRIQAASLIGLYLTDSGGWPSRFLAPRQTLE